MLLKEKPKLQPTWILPASPELVTPYSLTIVLAYLQYYTPKRLKNGRFLAVKHLRNLSDWINHPAPNLRSIQQHKVLAMHVVLLQASGLIAAQSNQLMPQPFVTRWLHMPYKDVYSALLRNVQNLEQWQEACQQLGVENVIDLDARAYLQQSFARQQTQSIPETPHNLHWLTTGDEIWHLSIPQTLPLWLQFDLRQLGVWTPDDGLTCTPFTIATASQRGYSLDTIEWLLETGSQAQLSSEQKRQLHQWCRRADTYTLRTVQLLSTAQPAQMADMLRQKRLRKHVVEQISSRHLIVTSTMVPHLEKWLEKQQIPLEKKYSQVEMESDIEEQTAVQWLGTRILAGLHELTNQPIPSPYSLLEDLESQLDDRTYVDLEAIATNLLNDLREAIQGRDAFLPAQQPVPQERIDLIQKAIWDDDSLQIQYQPLGSRQPSWREVQPHRLEQRGALYYLYAYCFRAETNLTFRLDRIYDIEA